MVKFVITPQILERFLTVAETGYENPSYVAWEEQEALLCTWFLSTISSSLLSRFVLLEHSW